MVSIHVLAEAERVDEVDLSLPPVAAAGNSRGRGLACLMQFAGWAFAIVTIAVNFADVVTDIIVAVEFHQQGETTWFALVVTFLLVANLAMAIFANEVHARSRWPVVRNWDPIPRFVLCFLMGPLLPVVTFVIDMCRAEDDDGQEDAADDVVAREFGTSGQSSSRGGSRFMREEAAEGAASRAVSNALLHGLAHHFRRYGVFYIETATESAPQAVIQLLAITFMGRASYAQLISLCCSLFSIMSKAVIFAASYDVKVFIFSFLIVAHDVFSTFYLFSTVVAQETQKDTDFLGLAVSYLGYAWLMKVFVFAACYVFAGIMFLIPEFKDSIDAHSCGNWRRYTPILLLLLGGVFVGPVLLAAEFLRLGTFTVLRFLSEEDVNRRSQGGIAMLWNFLIGDDARGSRLRHVAECFMVRDAALGAHGYSRMWDTSLRAPRTLYQDTYGYLDTVLTPVENDSNIPTSVNYYPITTDYDLLVHFPALFFGPLWKHLKAIGPDGRLTLWDFERWTRCSPRTMTHPKTQRTYFFLSRVKDEAVLAQPKDWGKVVVTYVAVSVFTVGQVLSFVYPFINASVNFHSHNLLQAVCFYGLCATLLLALPFVPATYRHQIFRRSLCSLPTSNFGAAVVAEWIHSYYTPSPSVALQVAVDASVVPSEVMAAVVAPFVGSAVDVSDLTRDECRAVRAAARARSYDVAIALSVDDLPIDDSVAPTAGICDDQPAAASEHGRSRRHTPVLNVYDDAWERMDGALLER
jgi:hypothetical protein